MLNVMNRTLIERNAQATLDYAIKEGNPASNLVALRSSKVFLVLDVIFFTVFNYIFMSLDATNFDGTFYEAASTALSIVVLKLLLKTLFHCTLTQFLQRAAKGRVNLGLMFIAFAIVPVWVLIASSLQNYVSDYALWMWSNGCAGVVVGYYELEIWVRLFSLEPACDKS